MRTTSALTSIELPIVNYLGEQGPQAQDPLPYISAGLSSIETKYAEYDPTTSVLGITFNGTTRGVLPQGWNTISYFNTVPTHDQPPVMYYNYSVIRRYPLFNKLMKFRKLTKIVLFRTRHLRQRQLSIPREKVKHDLG